MKRWLAAVWAFAAVMALFGCGKEKEPDFTKEEELPYGATMHSDKENFAVPMTYDRRFLDEKEVSAAAALLGAMQSADAEAYSAAVPPGYADYQLAEVYDYQDMNELVTALHDSVAAKSGEDFTFEMVVVNSIATDMDTGGLSESLALLDGISQGDEKFSDTVEKAFDLNVEWDISYNSGSESVVVSEQHLYLFETSNGCWCLL